MNEQLFYLQDSRGYVGNDVLFWANGGGYTTDVSKAEVFSLTDAQAQHNSRPSDIPWPKEYIDARTRPAVDMQYIKKAEAMEGSGITLYTPPKEKREQARCWQCNSFMRRHQFECTRCGTDNRP